MTVRCFAALPMRVVVCLLLVLIAAPTFAADVSDSDKAEQPKPATPLPSQVDLRPQLEQLGLGPRRQGRRGTCSVFTTAAALEYALSKQAGQGVLLSVEYLNWASNEAIHQQLDGGFFHDILKGYDKHGICTEDQMPYQRKFHEELTPSEESIASAAEIKQRPITVHWINPWRPEAGLTDEQMHEIKEVLAAGWVVAAGSSHSRLLVGYIDDPDQPGGGTFLTKDSGSGRFDSITYEFTKEKVGDVFWVEAEAKSESASAEP